MKILPLLLFPLAVFAQNPAAPPPDAAPPVKERTIYVPYEDLSAALGDKSQGVFLPYAEFLEMWNQLNLQRKQETEKPPADAVLATAEYKGTVQGDVVTTQAVLKVESFKEKGFAVLPLAPAGLAISAADTGDVVLRLGEKGHEAILAKKGPAELKLTLMSKLTRNAGRTSLSLALPRAPVTRFALTVPETGWTFEVAPGGAFTAQPAADGNSTLLEFFNGGEAGTVTVSWQKQGGGPALTPLLFTETTQSVKVSPGAVQTSLTLDWRILRAGVDKFSFTVPQPHQVLSVSGENLREWTPGEVKDGAQEVTVLLHAPARAAAKFTVELEAPLNELPAEVMAPQVTLGGVIRQRGTVTVHAAPELDVTLADPTGLSRQEVVTVKDAAPPLGNFRFLQTPWSLKLSAKRAEPVVEAAGAVRVNIEPDTTTFTTRLDVDVKRAGIFDLRVQVPAGWKEMEATGDAVESSRVTTEAGSEFLDIKLKARMQGKLAVSLTGRLPRATPAEDVTLPAFSLPAAAQQEFVTGVFLHVSLDANSKDAGSMKPDDAQKVAAALASGEAVTVPVLAFRHRDAAAKPAVLTMTQKPAQVTGDVLTMVQLREQTVRFHWRLHYQVAYAPVDGFVISLPQEIAAALRVEGSKVKETTKDYKPAGLEAGAGRAFWRFEPRDRKTGPLTIELTMEQPAPAFEAGKPADVKLPEIELHGIAQETGQIAVVKDAALEVLKDTPFGLESMDPRELRAPLTGTDGVILAWKQLRHPLGLTLAVTRNVPLPVPQSVITWMVLRTAVAHDGAATTEAVYWVKNNGQQLLTVTLPAGGRILSDVQVGETPQQPQRRAGGQDLLVRLPSSVGSAGKAIPVRFVYEVRPEKAQPMGWSGDIALAPAVVDSTVLQAHQTLWLPVDFRYLEFNGSMRVQRPTESWDRLRVRLSALIPALAPDEEAVTNARGTDPPEAPEARGGFSFHVPSDGQKHVLRRLNAAAPVTIGYRSRRWDNALHAGGLFVAFIAGLLLLRRSLEVKCVWFAVLGLGPLILMRLVPAGTAGPMQSLALGTLMAAGVWLLAGLRNRRRKQKPARSMVPMSPMGPMRAPANKTPPAADPPTPTEPTPETPAA